MRLLVAGADQVDAGKTTFSTGLVEDLGATGFKPRAGNDHWYDQDDYRHATERGRMYGKDAKRLAAASAADVTPEGINPVHRLWTPTPGAGTGLLGREGRQFLLDRVRVAGGDASDTGADDDASPRDEYVVNGTVDLPESAREALPIDGARTVEALPALNQLMASLYADAFGRVAERIRRTDRAVVESYSDIASPLPTLDVDAVAVVEPARARIYDGDRYMRAREVASGGAREGSMETIVETVVDLADPVVRTELPALSSAEQSDPRTVADAYAHAYEALVATALE